MGTLELIHRSVTSDYVDDLERQVRQMRETIGATSLQDPALVQGAVMRHMKEHTSQRLASLNRTLDLVTVALDEMAALAEAQKVTLPELAKNLNRVCTELVNLRNQVSPINPTE